MNTNMTIADILTTWTARDIRNVLQVEPESPCELLEDHDTFRLYKTANGRLAVGPGVGESGASFDSREITGLLQGNDLNETETL